MALLSAGTIYILSFPDSPPTRQPLAKGCLRLGAGPWNLLLALGQGHQNPQECRGHKSLQGAVCKAERPVGLSGLSPQVLLFFFLFVSVKAFFSPEHNVVLLPRFQQRAIPPAPPPHHPPKKAAVLWGKSRACEARLGCGRGAARPGAQAWAAEERSARTTREQKGPREWPREEKGGASVRPRLPRSGAAPP